MFYLYAARAARGLGDGFAAIILPTYLSELGLNPFQIGIVATAALRVVARQSCSTLQLADNRIERAVGVLRRAEIAQARVRLGGEAFQKRGREPRFAEPQCAPLACCGR
jgi:hypothetical protein